MVIMVARTVLVRVRPNGLLVFKLHGDTEGENQRPNVSGEEQSQHQLMRAEDGEGSPADTRSAAAVAGAAARAAGGGGTEAEPGGPRQGFWLKVVFVTTAKSRAHRLVVCYAKCVLLHVVEITVARYLMPF